MTMISGALNDALSNQEKWSSPISDLHGLFISIKWFFQFRLALLKVKTLVTSTGIKIVSFSSLKHSLPWPVSILCVIDFATKTSCHFYLLALKKTFQKMKKNLVRKPCTKWSTFISEIGLSSLKKKRSKHLGTSNLINYIWSQILSRLILNRKMPKAQVL